MYAIVETGGKQYRVAPGDMLRVEKLAGDVGSEVELPVKASFKDGGELVSGGTVKATILGNDRAAKILVFKFKRKKQYKKLIGHRQQFTAVRITGIEFNGEKASVPALGVHKAKAEGAASHAKRSRAAGSGKVAKKATKAKATASKKPSKKK